MKVAFWLIPAEPDRTIYQSLINDLSNRYNTPTFAPHVTLHSCECNRDQAVEFLNSHSNIDIVLETDQILYSEEFTKTLFIQLFSNSQLDQLSEFCKQSFEPSFLLNPHLSLIYANLAESEKRSLIPQIPLKQSIRFDQIRAIHIPRPVRTREDVEAWQEI
jgi:hypothetical protein